MRIGTFSVLGGVWEQQGVLFRGLSRVHKIEWDEGVYHVTAESGAFSEVPPGTPMPDYIASRDTDFIVFKKKPCPEQP